MQRKAARLYYTNFGTEQSLTAGEAAARTGITKTELHKYMADHPGIGMPETREEAEEYLDMLNKEEADEILGSNTNITESELEFIKQQKDISDVINKHLDYPNLNALIAAYHKSDKIYEEKLITYKPEEMYDEHAVYWMLTLGQIKSEKAYDRILPYTETCLFHQAYVAMADINPEKAFAHFEKYLDAHCKEIERHESGLGTLAVMIKNNGTKELKKYDLSDPAKKTLVDKALDEAITW